MKLASWFLSICSFVLLTLCIDKCEASNLPNQIFRGMFRNSVYWRNHHFFRQIVGQEWTKLIAAMPHTDGNTGTIEEIDQIKDDYRQLIDNSGLVLGDVLLNAGGEAFFFMEKSKSDGTTSTLLRASTGRCGLSSHINEFVLVKQFQPETVHYLDYSSDPDVDDRFKFIQSYENFALLGSVRTGMIFVAPADNVDGMIRVDLQKRLRTGKERQLKSQEAEKKRILDEVAAAAAKMAKPFAGVDDFTVSPDSVAYVPRERSIIQKLFGQNAPTELRSQFIQQKFIAMLVKNELSFTDAMTILQTAEGIFREEKTVGCIQVRPGQGLTVVGDIHGQLEDLLRIFSYTDWPSPTKLFLFNGDIVDRGSASIECLMLLYVLKITFPCSVFINRGNHESESCGPGTFLRDCSKFDGSGDFYRACQAGFVALPIAHVINDRVYVVHGGIRADFSIKDLSGLSRFEMNAEMRDFVNVSLWDDASEIPGLTANQERGLFASKFGPDVTESFLQQNEFDLLIRSHTFTPEGIVSSQGGKCWTVFSAPDYLGRGNKAAVVTFDSELTPLVLYFESRNKK